MRSRPERAARQGGSGCRASRRARSRARKPCLGAGTPGGRPEDMAGDAVQVGDLSTPAGRPDGAEDPGTGRARDGVPIGSPRGPL